MFKRHLRRKFPRFWKVLHTVRRELREYPYWNRRILEVKKCPDNARIPRVASAGRVLKGRQIMHNGVLVLAGSYYGRGGQRLLLQNRGCHEPQEEFVFRQVLHDLKPGAIMIECGAYWSFYSIWFCKEILRGVAYLIEPERENLEAGRKNFELNGLAGGFFQKFVGSENHSSGNGCETITLDAFVKDQSLEHVDILHADIQGAELDMLRGAELLIQSRRVSFFFISTHSEELHENCEGVLLQAGYYPFVSIAPCQSFSVDGVLVARSEGFNGMQFDQPSKKVGW
jgi:hypothetical protein